MTKFQLNVHCSPQTEIKQEVKEQAHICNDKLVQLREKAPTPIFCIYLIVLFLHQKGDATKILFPRLFFVHCPYQDKTTHCKHLAN